MKKTKVLWLSDIFCNSGFANVAHNILKDLIKTGRYDITIVGINYYGEPYDHEEWPVKVFPAVCYTKKHNPAYDDVYGRQRVIDELATGNYDILFTLQDPQIMVPLGPIIKQTKEGVEKQFGKTFKWIYYFPIDSYVRKHWVDDAIGLTDYAISYTEYGKSAILQHDKNINIKVINHGVDLSVYHRLPRPEWRELKIKAFEGKLKHKFIVSNINRNQSRKGFFRTLQVFYEFKRFCTNAVLYIHARHNDVGGDFRVMATDLGLIPGQDIFFPESMGEEGFPVEIVNGIYNLSDVVISTTHGEGWGLSTTEAMACQVPVVMPNNTSMTEICGEGRGLLVNCDDSINYGRVDNNIFRPMVNVKEFAKALLKVKEGGPEIDSMVKSAYQYALAHSWDKINKQWIELFNSAVVELSKWRPHDVLIRAQGQRVQLGKPDPK